MPGALPECQLNHISGGTNHLTESRTPARTAKRPEEEPPKKSFRKRFLITAGGIIVAALTASLTAWLTNLPGDVSKIIFSPSPVLVSVRHLPGQSAGCGYWIVNKPPQDLTPMVSNIEDLSALESWVYDNNAADTYSTELEVTVQGLTSRPVVLTDLQFIVVRRNYGAIPGALIGNACGGPESGRYIEVNLSKQPVRIVASVPDRFGGSNEPAWQLKPVIFPYTVSATDTEIFKIIADANQCDCEWYAKLYWSTDGKNGESIIDDQGRPFRTAPYQRVTATYSYDQNSRRWIKDASPCQQPTEFTCSR